jgi:hypothetical protein
LGRRRSEIVEILGLSGDLDEATGALRSALKATFPGIDLRSDNGRFRDQLDERLRLICRRALGRVVAPTGGARPGYRQSGTH